MNLIDRINNDSLRGVAEILSDHGYNPDWKNNDRSGDWYLGHHGDWDGIKEYTCEAIVIPSHDGFGEQVMDCFINECDKNKDIDYVNTRWERVIYVKGKFNDLTREQIAFLYGDE